MKYSDADAYTDPETGVLKNRLGLTTEASLDEAEASAAFLRALELEQNPIKGNFDLAHLKAIHLKLFGDIYQWAGEIRTVDIAKGNTRFANNAYIEGEANRLTDQLRKEQCLQGMSADQFSERAAHYLGELNVLHPFRDGNGRTLRCFMGQLAQDAGYEIRWENIDRDDMIKASIEAYESSPVLMTKLIKDNLVDLYREQVLELAIAATGNPSPVVEAKPGQKYCGNIVALNQRYVAQEVAASSAIVLHESKFLSGLHPEQVSKMVEIVYPFGHAGVVHQQEKSQEYGREHERVRDRGEWEL